MVIGGSRSCGSLCSAKYGSFDSLSNFRPANLQHAESNKNAIGSGLLLLHYGAKAEPATNSGVISTAFISAGYKGYRWIG